MTERAQRIMEAFYLTFVDKRQDFIVQKLNNDGVAAAIRAIVNEFQYYQCCKDEGVEDMVVDARLLYDLADELEAL
jgi:hypothetical protein